MPEQHLRTYSLHLAKPGVEPLEFLTEKTRESLSGRHMIETTPNPGLGPDSQLIIFKSEESEPTWAGLLQQAYDFRTLLRHSFSAVLLFKAANRVVAATWGQGWHCIEERNRENDFGLRCVINIVDPEKLRNLSKSNLLSSIDGTSSTPFGANIYEFDIDDAFEVIRAVKGNSVLPLIKRVTGGKSLRVDCYTSLAELPKLAQTLIERSYSKDYQETNFRVIDDLCPISDIELSEKLNAQLVSSINERSGEFELSIPEIEIGKFGQVQFYGLGRGVSPSSDVSLRIYLQHLNAQGQSASLQSLKEDEIRLIDDSGDTFSRAKIHASIIGSTLMNGRRYAINNGDWFDISNRQYEAATKFFNDVLEPHDPKLDSWRQVPTGKKLTDFRDETEREYLTRVCKDSQYELFDQVLFSTFADGRKELELCDIFDAERFRFIHVKKNSRRSASVSYLLEQGLRAAREFKMNEHVRNEFFDELRKRGLEQAADKLRVATPNEITFEYRIGDYPRENGDFAIPFFSRLALRAKGQDIRVMSYSLKLGFIPKPRPDQPPGT